VERLCLVTGATGYVGGRLVPRLLEAGFRVRVLARHPERVRDLPWGDQVEIASGEATAAMAMMERAGRTNVMCFSPVAPG